MTGFFDDAPNVVPLIMCENDKYSVNESAMDWISQHDKPFAVLACAGKYRTGKSFLLNRLADAEPGTGFGVGESVQACTKGLWMYQRFIDAGSYDILLIDTEGIDALDATNTHDVRIFTLALLLSSSFVYNSMGHMDEAALQTLSLMTRVTENIKISADKDATAAQLSSHMPLFYWVLRDFSLRLENKQGGTLSPDQYLEEALQGSSDKHRCSVREAIRDSFPSRTLITLPRPTADDSQLAGLERKSHAITTRFRDSVTKLRERIFLEMQPMRAQNVEMTGRMYVALCRHMTACIQTQNVPVIKDCWTLMQEVQAGDLRTSLSTEFREACSSLDVGNDFEANVNKLYEKFEASFCEASMRPLNPDHLKRFLDELHVIGEELTQKVGRERAERVELSLDELEKSIDESPETLAELINRAQSDFQAQYGIESMNVAWRAAVVERALCRWIPRSLASLTAARDAARQELSHSQSVGSVERDQLQQKLEEQSADFEHRLLEVQQTKDALTAELESEKRDGEDLRAKLLEIELELRSAQSNAAPPPTVVSNGELEYEHDTLSKQYDSLTVEQKILEGDVQSEKDNHAMTLQQLAEVQNTLQVTQATNAQLEEDCRVGLEKVSNEYEYSLEKIRQSHQQDLDQKQNSYTELERQHEEQRNVAQDLRQKLQLEGQRLEHAGEAHERETRQLKDAATKSRDQCELAQQRVLSIHKSMLEDLRVRDERARDQQSRYSQEQLAYQAKYQDCSRENETLRLDNSGMKKRIVDLEGYEKEAKRLRVSEQQHAVQNARYESENVSLRSAQEQCLKDRASLRALNSELESKVTLLRNENKLLSATHRRS